MSTDKNKTTSVKHLDVEFKGEKIILPVIKGKPMAYDEAIEWMKRLKESDEQKTGILHTIQCQPLDGAVAFHRAMIHKYGWSQGVPTPGFFGSTPPYMIGVQISHTEKLNVPWGRIQIPGIDGWLSTGVGGESNPRFVISGEIKKKHASDVKELVELTERFLKEQSIYKGQAIKVSFGWTREDDEDGDKRSYHPIDDAPSYMQLDGVKEDQLIFGDKVLNALRIGLFTPVEHSEACRQNGVPLKRGILLYGPYGTGKTMTSAVTALKAVRNNWTFIYLDSVRDLKRGLELAAQYAPAVLFAEDIDRAVTGERSIEMDEILNTLDGVDTKGAEIITVLTTNHIEQINPALLRMGRLDTLVEVLPPDAKAAERLVKLYARDLLDDTVDLKKVGKALEGKIPAFIREVTERAKIATIQRIGSADIKGHVREEDLLDASKSMEPHVALLEPRETGPAPHAELLVKIPANSSKAAAGILKHYDGGLNNANRA